MPVGSVWRDVLVKEADVRVALGATKEHNYVFIIIIRKMIPREILSQSPLRTYYYSPILL